MTLIVGTPHWRGVCITSDTRETITSKITGDKTYQDNVLKFALVAGGIGIAATGDKGLNIIFRSVLSKVLKDDAKKTKYKSSDNPLEYFGSLVMKALKSTPKHPQATKYLNKNGNSRISGLVGGCISWLPLRIWPDEAKNLIEIILNSPSLNSVYTKHHQEIIECSQELIPHKDFLEYPYSFLLMYNLVLDRVGKPLVWSVLRVPFGTIAAFGSGSKFPVYKYSPRILSWVLLTQEPEDIEIASMHLAQVHGYADKYIQPEFGFSFKTFGGGIVPGIITEKGVGVVEGKIMSKPDKVLISDVFSLKGKLWVQTPKKDKYILEEFTSVSVPKNVTLVL